MIHYKIDVPYAPESAGVIQWNDPDIAIEWPVEQPSVLSPRDVTAPSFATFITTYNGGIQA
jgi:dTDP-4-dehydrorhamnose 3,5-epimerase